MIWFALCAVLLWILGTVCAFFGTKKAILRHLSDGFYLCGCVVLTIFIVGFWINLDRPPLRTMGETRLWYAFFLPLCGWVVYKRYGYAFVLVCSTVMAAVFLGLNVIKPEIHDKTLMPALQSVWFCPHVMIYMFAYALLAVAFLLACYRLIFGRRLRDEREAERYADGDHKRDEDREWCEARHNEHGDGRKAQLEKCEDDLTRIGWVCLCIGLFLGSLWAKQAWGHFWTWDPKETWGAATFLCYGLYLHLRLAFPKAETWAQVVQIIGFVLLQICWYGINLIPFLGQSSLHIYS